MVSGSIILQLHSTLVKGKNSYHGIPFELSHSLIHIGLKSWSDLTIVNMLATWMILNDPEGFIFKSK